MKYVPGIGGMMNELYESFQNMQDRKFERSLESHTRETRLDSCRIGMSPFSHHKTAHHHQFNRSQSLLFSAFVMRARTTIRRVWRGSLLR